MLSVSIGLFGQDQLSETDFDEIIWYGLDYSVVKFIGSELDFTDIDKIQNHYFGAWNQLILDESKKYGQKNQFNLWRDMSKRLTRWKILLLYE